MLETTCRNLDASAISSAVKIMVSPTGRWTPGRYETSSATIASLKRISRCIDRSQKTGSLNANRLVSRHKYDGHTEISCNRRIEAGFGNDDSIQFHRHR